MLSYLFWGSQAESATSCCEPERGDGSVPPISHKPVMQQEVLSLLNLRPGMVVLDATLGLAGHALPMAQKITPGGRLIGIDKDEAALAIARAHLKDLSPACVFVHDDFRNLDRICNEAHVSGVDAVLFDLGVSSLQLDDPARGFGIRHEGPLDMRMDQKSFIAAYDLVNTLTEEEISSILWKFGQERFSRPIARAIARARAKAPIASTQQLADLVCRAIHRRGRHQRIHPATRTFQALRIAVNRELDALDEAIKKAALFLNKGGRIAVIAFHSLEDRIVKENFRELAATGRFRLVFKKVLRPSNDEMEGNPRSRSARLRMIERIS